MTFEFLTKSCGFYIFLDLAVTRQCNSACFLRNDYDNGIDDLGKTDCSSVPCPKALAEFMVLGEREKTSCLGKLPLLDDDGSIMDRRLGKENRGNKLTGNLCIYVGTYS